MKVLIVGGGIAGLTLAHVLNASDIEYEIIERSKDGDPERQGFIIGLWSSGRVVLKKLGLVDRFDALSAPTHVGLLCRGDGSLLKRISFKPLEDRDGSGMSGIRRRDLFSILVAGIPRHAFRYNTTIKEVKSLGDVVSVTCSDGSTTAYDVVVGADGAKSWIRNAYFKEHAEEYTDWRVWCSWIPTEYETKQALNAYIEPNELAVVVHAKNEAMVWLVSPANHVTFDDEQGRVERLKKYFNHIPTLIPGALESVADNAVPVSDFLEIRLSQIVKDRVALIGDAAHCLGPYTGFSSSMAMEDAYILGQELIQASMGALTVHDALKRYETTRKPRIEKLRVINNTIRWIVLAKSPFSRMVHNAVLRLIPARCILFATGIMTGGNIK